MSVSSRPWCIVSVIIINRLTTEIPFPPSASVKFNLKLGLFDSLAKVPEEYEIVFCSMDRSEEDYDKFCAKMSGWCLPYAMSTLPKLITTYKAHALPHLVVIDKDGSLITMDGVQSIMTDPVGKNFPWRRIRVVDVLPETYIIKKDGEEVQQPMSYLDDRHLMLYFAARSDDLSKEFTPWMTKAYKILKGKRGDDFEVSRKSIYEMPSIGFKCHVFLTISYSFLQSYFMSVVMNQSRRLKHFSEK